MYKLKWFNTDYDDIEYDYAEDAETAIEWLFLKNISLIDRGLKEGTNIIYENLFRERGQELDQCSKEEKIKEFIREDLKNGRFGYLYVENVVVCLSPIKTITKEELKVVRNLFEKGE